MDPHRPDQLTPTSHDAGEHRTTGRARVDDATVSTRIVEIDSRLCAEEPSLARRFDRLDRPHRRTDLLILVLLAVSALALAIAVSYRTWPAGVLGAVTYITALTIARRSPPESRSAGWTRSRR